MKDNKLIAEFMGVGKLHEAQSSNQWNQYHTSWDCLMPVLNKCRQENQLEYFDRVYYALEQCDINITYKAVVEFINQHDRDEN